MLRIRVRECVKRSALHHRYASDNASTSTYAFQNTLPRLPVPDIPATVFRYMRSLQPLLKPSEYAQVEKLAREFEASKEIHSLQESLKARASTQLNWLEEWWDGGVYTQPRLSLPINYNYFLRFSDSSSHTNNQKPVVKNGISHTAIHRGAQLLHGMARFYVELVNERIAPDKDKDGWMCMNQYARLFAHARIPKHGDDELRCYTKKPASLPTPHYSTKYMNGNPRHIILMARNRFYSVNILDEALTPRSVKDIARDMFVAATKAMSAGENPHPVGVLTAVDRDVWATARTQLTEHSQNNRNALEAIDSALWVVNLDNLMSPLSLQTTASSVDSRPFADVATAGSEEFRSSVLTTESPRYLFGRGDAADRWFDKHQLTLCANGGAGLLLEHAPGDGLTLVRLMKYCADVERGSVSAMEDVAAWDARDVGDAAAQEHVIECPEAVKRAIHETAATFSVVTGALTTSVVASDVGAARIKSMRLPPDAFYQMAFQLAHFQLYGYCGSTYESTSTRSFAQGRTETTRSVSVESAAFVAAACQKLPHTSYQLRRLADLLAAACSAHGSYAKAAKQGFGVDRHLLGLRVLAAERGIRIPLLEHPSYAMSRHWRLSTSNCGGADVSLFGFGPVVDDGFGLAYLINSDAAAVNITAWGGNGNTPATHSRDFAVALRDALCTLCIIGETNAKLQQP